MTEKTSSSKEHLTVLLIGREERLLWFMPPILAKAGFAVDILTHAKLMGKSQFVRNCEVLPSSQSLLSRAAIKCHEGYDLILITEDGLLLESVQADLPLETKLKLLPILQEENFLHVHSKIGLSKVLSAKGIQTPAYREVLGLEQALIAAEEIGYPVMVKVDASGGGAGVYECHQKKQLLEVPKTVWEKPLLLQKRIEGASIDLSALYLSGKLIHFSYSKVEKSVPNQFGPSSLRTYSHLSAVEEAIFKEMQALGTALGANGFTNVHCIEASDGSGRYYIEADMRTNVWADTASFLGESVSQRILEWYQKKKTLSYPVAPPKNGVLSMRIPYFLRLTLLELMFNRYNVWKFIPWEDREVVKGLLWHKIYSDLAPRYSLIDLVKLLTPKRSHKYLKKIYLQMRLKA